MAVKCGSSKGFAGAARPVSSLHLSKEKPYLSLACDLRSGPVFGEYKDPVSQLDASEPNSNVSDVPENRLPHYDLLFVALAFCLVPDYHKQAEQNILSLSLLSFSMSPMTVRCDLQPEEHDETAMGG